MSLHGTPLEIGRFARLAGAVTANLPRELDPKLALDFAGNGDALAMLLVESLTRENLNRVLKTLRKPVAKPAPAPQPKLLILVGTAPTSATAMPFNVAKRFVRNTADNAAVKISHINGNFTMWFGEKMEPRFAGSMLRCNKLSRRSVDGPIIAELGGEEKAETTLTELFALMRGQRNGESGPLLINGHTNIFYVCDTNNVLRTVYVRWYDDGWFVRAFSVTDQGAWDGGDRVFSRNS